MKTIITYDINYRDERYPTKDIDNDLEMEYQMERWYK